MSIPLLSTLIFFPVLGGLSLLIFPRQQTATIRLMALFVSLVELLLTLPVVLLFDKTTARMQFTELHPWISTLNINYSLGIDGISILFLLLTALITLLSVLVSWEAIHDKVQEFFVALLLLEGGDDGGVLRHRFFPVLHLLGGHAHPDVPDHRHLGRPNRIYPPSSSSSTPWSAAC
jgi:NADH-quinone oxidoreductase subunit M